MKKSFAQVKKEPDFLENGHFKYYKVFYSKDVNKKKRIFSEGILACENKKTRLFNTDGEVLVQVLEKNTPEIDEEYVIGYKFAVLIDSEIDKQDFVSGKIFISIVNQTTGSNILKKPAKANFNQEKGKNLLKNQAGKVEGENK